MTASWSLFRLGLPAGLEGGVVWRVGLSPDLRGRVDLHRPASCTPGRRLLRRRALPDLAMIERYAAAPGKVAGVLVGHTHFDHAVDAPALARRYGARAYGSASLGHLMRPHGLGELAVEVVPHEPYELRPSWCASCSSRHSKPPTSGARCRWGTAKYPPPPARPQPGQLQVRSVLHGIRIQSAGISLYHQGSADLDDRELRGDPVDVFLAGVAGPQRHAALLGAHPPEAGPARGGAHPLRQLLHSAWTAAAISSRVSSSPRRRARWAR